MVVLSLWYDQCAMVNVLDYIPPEIKITNLLSVSVTGPRQMHNKQISFPPNVLTQPEHVGYVVPLEVKMCQGRSSKSQKRYTAQLVCMISKAIHIKVVTAMASAAFLAAYRRFTATPISVATMYIAYDTTFVGAAKILKEDHPSCKIETNSDLTVTIAFLA